MASTNIAGRDTLLLDDPPERIIGDTEPLGRLWKGNKVRLSWLRRKTGHPGLSTFHIGSAGCGMKVFYPPPRTLPCSCLTRPISTCYKKNYKRPTHDLLPSPLSPALWTGAVVPRGIGVPSTPVSSPVRMLAVPIRERLVLLALTDGAVAAEMKRTLKVKDDDVRLTSPRMREAVATLGEALLDSYGHLPDPDGLTNDTQRQQAEHHLRQLLFASMAVCLVGEAVPPRMTTLSLRDRILLYLLLVEEVDWKQAQELTGCTEHGVRSAIKHAMEQIGGA